MSPVVLVCPVVSLVHHHVVQAVALLLHGHLLVHALDPQLNITQVGMKAPNPFLDHPDWGKYQNCHLVLKGSFWFFLVLFLVLLSSFFVSLVLFQFPY